MIINKFVISCVPKKNFHGDKYYATHRSKTAGKFNIFLLLDSDKKNQKIELDKNYILTGKMIAMPVSGEIMQTLFVEGIKENKNNEEINEIRLTVDIEKFYEKEGNYFKYFGTHFRQGYKPFPIELRFKEKLPVKSYIEVFGYFKEFRNRLTGKEKSYIIVQGYKDSYTQSNDLINNILEFIDSYSKSVPYNNLDNALKDEFGIFDDRQKEKIRDLINVSKPLNAKILNKKTTSGKSALKDGKILVKSILELLGHYDDVDDKYKNPDALFGENRKNLNAFLSDEQINKLCLIPKISAGILKNGYQRKTANTPNKTVKCLKEYIAVDSYHSDSDNFYVLFMSKKNNLLDIRSYSLDPNTSYIECRKKVIKDCLSYEAASLVIGQNSASQNSKELLSLLKPVADCLNINIEPL